MLGRLPNSKSLLVNKGFKNLGASVTANKLSGLNFPIPVGISIGRTNSAKLQTQKQSIEDIIKAFKIFEKSAVNNSYYELNISCPNLSGDISFYPRNNLEELLKEIDKLELTKPVYVKMPIGKTDTEFSSMLEVIDKHSPSGVIIGNLQTDRKHHLLDQEEVNKFTKGNFSGRPTFERSNELVRLTYKKFKDRFIIIGCGGIFSAKDAYTKIKLGASLVQLITGMIYQGPQLISQINLGLLDLLDKDGYKNIKEAIGKEN
jgi:dihydroorotate dehydrogenase